jgi:hypothetical protein
MGPLRGCVSCPLAMTMGKEKTARHTSLMAIAGGDTSIRKAPSPLQGPLGFHGYPLLYGWHPFLPGFKAHQFSLRAATRPPEAGR